MENFSLTGEFVCDTSSADHAVFTKEGLSVSVSGNIGGEFSKGEVYELSFTYVGDKPPHP